MTRSDIVDNVYLTICVDRNTKYGEPEDNFGLIGKLWSIYLDREIKAEDVAMMMVLFKTRRIMSGKVNPDNYIDLAGYAACAGEIATRGCENEN